MFRIQVYDDDSKVAEVKKPDLQAAFQAVKKRIRVKYREII
jgi:hypothetical protein